MPIFIAGTGRCGTDHLTRILGEHPEVWTFRHEGRFVVDAGGVEDLVQTLTTSYTHLHSNDALDRLERLLTERLAGKEESAFIQWNYPGQVGEKFYYEWVERFLGELTWYAYDETFDRPGGGPLVRKVRRIGRYFRDRKELIELCRSYVDELFSTVARDRGKRTWCEKTPFNLTSMPFLWELFPEAKIVHIMRHPLEVVASHLDEAQTWAPDDLDQVCWMLEPVYRRWFDLRDTYEGFDSRYIEVRLENLTADWPRQRAALFARLELSDFDTPSTMDATRVKHPGRRLTGDEETKVRNYLGFAIVGMGYE